MQTNKANFRSFGLSLAILAAVGLTAGCSNDSHDANASKDSGVAAPTLGSQPTEAPNEIDKDAEATYRQAIEASRNSASSNGLTELWFDSDNQLVQVSSQDESESIFVTQDLLDQSVYEVDESAMMPAMLLAELDALAVSGSDYGYVVFDQSQRIKVSNNIDDIVYVTTYEIGDDGLIYQAFITADGEPLGEITYTYSVTKEGKAALVALKATS